VTLKKGSIYEIRGSIYDFADSSSYVIRITSELINNYYKATIINTYNFDINIFPDDWEYIRELSSLEKELL
jgi:hypothetical protein